MKICIKHNSHHLITIRKRSCGNVMFSQVCVKDSVHKGGGVYPSMHWGRHTPGRHPLPPGRHPLPPGRHPLPPWVNPPDRPPCPVHAGIHPPPHRRPLQRKVRIPLECILVTGFVSDCSERDVGLLLG